MRPIFLFTLSVFFFVACEQPPNYPIEPEIEYVGVNRNIIAQGSFNAPLDTLIVTFSFTDGDGDIGDDSLTNVFLFDSRTGDLAEPIKVKPIPSQGTGNGISGEISGNTSCVSTPEQPVDTFSYTIQLRDRAGHFSNKVQTEPITILCN